jgi:hypothetical protein
MLSRACWSKLPNAVNGAFANTHSHTHTHCTARVVSTDAGSVSTDAGLQVRALSQELVMRWRAWNVYERVYKEFEALDKK